MKKEIVIWENIERYINYRLKSISKYETENIIQKKKKNRKNETIVRMPEM